MDTRKLANKLVNGAITYGGVTLDTEGNTAGQGAFLVGGAAPGFNVPQSGDMITLVNTVESWLIRERDALPGHLLGSWEYDGTLYFDIVTVLRADYEEDSYVESLAKELGRLRGEKAIGYIHNDGTFEAIGL